MSPRKRDTWTRSSRAVVDWNVIAVLSTLSLVPPLLFLVWMRSRERTEREPFRALLAIFFYGATVGVAAAFVLNTLFGTATWLYTGDTILADRLTAVLAAPFFEEAIKATGLALVIVRREMNEMEDGIIYGAAVGLGFAASENMFYGVSNLAAGAELAVMIVAIRVFSSTVMHAASSALIGFGAGRAHMLHNAWPHVVPYYLVAVALHAAYNLLVTEVPLVGFIAAIVMAWVALAMMRRHVRDLETPPHKRTKVPVPADRGRPPTP